MNLERFHLLPAANPMLPETVLGVVPAGEVVACDFHVAGAEGGEEVPGGYRLGRLLNIDHHAPTPRMARMISSTNLAIAQVNAAPVDPSAAIVLNHTDCDSVLSGGIAAGLLAPGRRYGDAAIAADHTGEPDTLADLLQGLQPLRDLHLSFSSLAALEEGRALSPVAAERLLRRQADRAQAAQYVRQGRFRTNGCVAWAVLDERLDAAFLPALLPDACLILLAVPMRGDGDRWEAKVRLGLSAPPGMSLHALELGGFDPAWGGRWNAGSNRRAGGTLLPVESYAAALGERVERFPGTGDPA
ncbi:MAG TPA: hypothetical protein VFQ76_22230, partial [Longimicrobiaceae bacterium]|nr:hypothetical protein [Longimicrobiaceae bacterium]